jgi:Acetyltransferase (GNAT) domain
MNLAVSSLDHGSPPCPADNGATCAPADRHPRRRLRPRLGSGPRMMRPEGQRVVLRRLRSEELDAVLEARDRLAIRAQPGGTPPRERLRRRLARSGRLARGHLDLAIEAERSPVGEIQARGHPAQTLPPGVFELGIVIYNPADRRKGYGLEAVAVLTGGCSRRRARRWATSACGVCWNGSALRTRVSCAHSCPRALAVLIAPCTR